MGTWLADVLKAAWIMNSSVSTAPISTTNITGLLHWISGRSITNDCFNDSRTSSGSNSLRLFIRRGGFGCSGVRSLRTGCAAAPISRPPKMLSPANPKLPELALVATQLSAEGDRPQVLGQRSERGNWQEQQRADDNDRPEEEATEGKGVVATGPQSKGCLLFHTEECRHRDRRYDRQVPPEQNHQTAADVPWNGFRRRIGVVIQAIAHTQAVKRGPV